MIIFKTFSYESSACTITWNHPITKLEENCMEIRTMENDQIILSIQHGILHVVPCRSHNHVPIREPLLKDFEAIYEIFFPKEGTWDTKPHEFPDFSLYIYAPLAFSYFSRLFNISKQTLRRVSEEPWTFFNNPGQSGSLFFRSRCDQFMIKTLTSGEAKFLRNLLPSYYTNLKKNPRTLLPKLFGFYSYKQQKKKVRILIMNNLIPSNIEISEIYDLKGSVYNRYASASELRRKKVSTFRDLNFLSHHPDGLFLQEKDYQILRKVVGKDCMVLRSFNIMDYSFFLGIHWLKNGPNFNFSFGSRCLQQEFGVFPCGIPACTAQGQKILLFVGIIDILQNFRFAKKMEYLVKALLFGSARVSVNRPDFYAERFQTFLFTKVFRISK